MFKKTALLAKDGFPKLIDKGLLTFAIEKVQITLSIGFFPPQKLGWMAGFGIYSVYLNLSLDKQ